MNFEEARPEGFQPPPDPVRVVRIARPGFPVDWGYPIGSQQQIYHPHARLFIVRYIYTKEYCPTRLLDEELKAFPEWVTEPLPNGRPFYRCYPLAIWEKSLIDGDSAVDFEAVFNRALEGIPPVCHSTERLAKNLLFSTLTEDKLRWRNNSELRTPTPSPSPVFSPPQEDIIVDLEDNAED